MRARSVPPPSPTTTTPAPPEDAQVPVARLCTPREHVARPHRATRRHAPREGALSPLLWAGCTSAFRGASRHARRAARDVVGGLGALARGHVRMGTRRLGQAVAAPVRIVLDAALSVGLRLVSGVQTRLGHEPPGCRLGARQITELRKVFGDSLDYDRVMLKMGKLGLLALPGRAFVFGSVLYVPWDSPTPISSAAQRPLRQLVRELCRVWQYQHGGTDYGCETLWSQRFAETMNWRAALNQGRGWAELDPEQQQQFLQSAYGQSRYFLAPDERFVDDITGVDYTPQLESALELIRAGRGAP
ncbi:hypothetical protein [Archangium primigenium]|uniref:hypothetical protein n=1 Tax=[Archangium] primigenium TaxID=2792470 RepID=UPI0019571414|nr:hypothetical protein [Archangium primigenium]MBM7112269.1 hypothetical protein [Archangium primigenium]